jgi:hypothetical protein
LTLIRTTIGAIFGVIRRVKNWKIIADNLSKAGWSWGCVGIVDARGRTIVVADARREDGKRFVVRADEKLTAFVEIESTIRLYLRNPRNLRFNDFSVSAKK